MGPKDPRTLFIGTVLKDTSHKRNEVTQINPHHLTPHSLSAYVLSILLIPRFSSFWGDTKALCGLT